MFNEITKEAKQKLEKTIKDKTNSEYPDINSYVNDIHMRMNETGHSGSFAEGTQFTYQYELSKFKTKSKNPELIEIIFEISSLELDEDGELEDIEYTIIDVK